MGRWYIHAFILYMLRNCMGFLGRSADLDHTKCLCICLCICINVLVYFVCLYYKYVCTVLLVSLYCRKHNTSLYVCIYFCIYIYIRCRWWRREDREFKAQQFRYWMHSRRTLIATGIDSRCRGGGGGGQQQDRYRMQSRRTMIAMG